LNSPAPVRYGGSAPDRRGPDRLKESGQLGAQAAYQLSASRRSGCFSERGPLAHTAHSNDANIDRAGGVQTTDDSCRS
jgi:hypothetical protein